MGHSRNVLKHWNESHGIFLWKALKRAKSRKKCGTGEIKSGTGGKIGPEFMRMS